MYAEINRRQMTAKTFKDPAVCPFYSKIEQQEQQDMVELTTRNC